jgi:Lecithin:cholesterol acyltransferase
MKIRLPFFVLIILFCTSVIFAQPSKTEKNPILVIPGIMGSRLKNTETNEEVWVKFKKNKNDDLSLPMTPNLKLNRDNLVAFDIVDEVKILKFLPGIAIYSDVLKFLENKLDFARGDWENPKMDSEKNQFYVFSYDWRLDNVENAHLLIRKIEKLKKAIGKPNLKFDVITHSMGGLIARYAAMYGETDLQTKPSPKWIGAKHFSNIFLIGTPNEGSMKSLSALNEGYTVSTIAGKFRPEVFSRDVAFSSPSIFQLLPHGKSVRFYDEDLKPLNIDIYDSANWKKYGWNITSDPNLALKIPKAKRLQIDKYLDEVLAQTKKFHESLDVQSQIPNSLTFYGLGSNCKETLDGAIVYFDKKDDIWKTLTRSSSFKNSKDQKIDKKDVEATIFADGDGTVSSRSFLGETFSKNNANAFIFNQMNTRFFCEAHTMLPGNTDILSEIATKLGLEIKETKQTKDSTK